MEIREQAADNTTVEVKKAESGKVEENSFGRFDSKEKLIEAYNSLEAEFTRRSQKLKELEGKLSEQLQDEKWLKKVEELTVKYPIAENYKGEISSVLREKQELLEKENCLEIALLEVLAKGEKKEESSSEDEIQKEEKDAVLSSDLKNLFDKAFLEKLPEVSPSGGEIPVVLPHRPKTIKEAGDMAVKLFKTNRK